MNEPAPTTQALDPMDTPLSSMPTDLKIRAIALSLAVKRAENTVIKDGNMYQQLRLEHNAPPTTTLPGNK